MAADHRILAAAVFGMRVAIHVGMGGFLLLLCVAAIVSALAIVYLLYGPVPAEPLAPVPRASMTTIPPQQVVPAASYNPEAVFAAEHTSAIADASRAFATITPAVPMPSFMRGSVTSPEPLPRARAPRGTESPRSMPTSHAVPSASARDSFIELDPTLLVDETIAS